MTETTQPPLLSTGRTWQEMPVGLAFRTPGRTMTETDLVNFLGLSLYTEPLFLEANHAAEGGYSGRLIPGGLTFIVAEGLVQQTNVLHGTGLAFMHSDLDSRKPVNPNGFFRVGSNTKRFISVVVLQLVAEHLLSLDDTVGRWLPPD